jgi:hypothetical protein
MASLEVIVHTNSGILGAPRETLRLQPPVVNYRLADDLEIKTIEHALADKVMSLCEPQAYGLDVPVVRQFAQLYSFVRSGSLSERIWGQRDNRLYVCIALSRLVHPTSVGFIYHAQLNFGPDEELTRCIPISLEGHPRGAWIADREGRDWLTETDAAQLERLVARTPLTVPARISRALWYNELAATNYFADVRWVLIATALESLIHTSRQRIVDQFTSRTAKLAAAIGLPTFTETEARAFYHQRSHLVHGRETGKLPPRDYALYRLGEDVLRKVIARAILEPSFAATFVDDAAVEGNWAR